MNNKYVMSRARNITYLKNNFADILYKSMRLARYEISKEELEVLLKENPEATEVQLALANFIRAYEFICEDLECNALTLETLHHILMKGLNDACITNLNEEQKTYLYEMINQPAKANTEIAIDVALYILSKRLFSDGDVRVAILFANKIMIDNGNGIMAIPESKRAEFRELLHRFKDSDDRSIKEWLYRNAVMGVKLDY